MSALITGERLYLRRLLPEDVDESYVGWFTDDDLVRYYSGSRRRFGRDVLLEELARGVREETLFIYGIFLTESDRCIGNIRVGPIVREHRISDLVVFIGDRAQHGKGLAAEAIALGNRAAWELHDLRKLFGGMYEANRAAVGAYTKAGWVVEGRLRGHYWVEGRPMDRVLVGCFNPKYFPPAALLLDFDGTLADTVPVLRDVYARFVTERGSTPTAAEFDEFNGVRLPQTLAALRSRHHWTEDVDTLVAAYEGAIARHRPACPLAAGARELLTFARGRGMKVAVVTSASRAATAAWLDTQGLSRWIDQIVGADDVAEGKPSPEPYRHAATALGVAPDACVAVEDSPLGAQAALAAGVTTFVVRPDAALAGATPCEGLAGVLSALRRL